jgi:hypothetical protein
MAIHTYMHNIGFDIRFELYMQHSKTNTMVVSNLVLCFKPQGYIFEDCLLRIIFVLSHICSSFYSTHGLHNGSQQRGFKS